MAKLTKMLRDYQTLRLDIETEITRLGLPPGTTPEQLAALTTEAYEEGFTTGIGRKRGRPPGIKSQAIPPERKRGRKAQADPKKEARNLRDRTQRAILKVLGDRALTRGQIAERTGLDPELVSECLHQVRKFVETPGHRWRAKNPVKEEGGEEAKPKKRPFKEVVASVMGRRTMSAAEVVEALDAKGLMPESKRPTHYLHVTLATNRGTFERVEKGRYRVAR